MMEVQSGWKWNEWRKALSVLTILHEERRKREGKERELSYMEVLSHGDALDIQHPPHRTCLTPIWLAYSVNK
jgi:hypothetical protein